MDMSTLNWPAILVAALSCFCLGGLWFSPILFGKAWQRANKLSDEELKKMNAAKIFGFSFVFAVVMSFNLAMFLNSPFTDASFGAMAGFLAGFGWVAMAMATTALFERRSWSYILINTSYHVVSLTIMGTILGAWR